MVNILPSEFLKRIIQNTPNELKTSKYYSKILDKSDPRVYYIKNYDINSFKSCGAHNHPGKERAVYFPLTYTFPVKNTNVESVMEKNNSSEIPECIEKTEPDFSLELKLTDFEKQFSSLIYELLFPIF